MQQVKKQSFRAQLIFAHGAGNDQYSEFMQDVCSLFQEAGILCHLFDFPYMEKARELGKRRPPDKMATLLVSFQQQVLHCQHSSLPLFIGGKSMGGRVATMLPEESKGRGVICFGYPFHPPGKPEKTRIEHLTEATTPICIVQGEKDPFGKPEEIASYGLADEIDIHFLVDGEHSFKTPKRSVITSQQNLQKAVAIAVSFINKQLEISL